jgi:LysM repeat protein
MKPTLLFTALTMILATSTTFAKSELETLRALCAEQERQIRHLEEENTQLRDGRGAPAPKIHGETKSSLPPTNNVAAKTEAPVTSETIYVVKPGDSIDKIARKVGTSATRLARANGLKPASIIHPGQKLKVPGTSVAASNTVSASSVAPTAPARNTSGKSHTVRQGETFFSIAKKHGISTATLVAANPTVKASALRPGQVLRLGSSGPSTALISAPVSQIKATPTAEKAAVTQAPEVKQSAPPAPETSVAHTSPAAAQPAATPAPAVEKETAPAATEKKFRPVTIDGEMTYGEFAAKHGTDAERLNALNGLDLTTATVLAKGSELYVPAQP